MEKVIRNDWKRVDGPFEVANILSHEIHPEGLDVRRARTDRAGERALADTGLMLSVTKGGGRLRRPGATPLRLGKGSHVYLPALRDVVLEADAGTELIEVQSPSAKQARGTQLIVRDEQFLVAAGTDARALRWILTPQYLSRRIFLEHDQTLVSRSGHPVSWFHTTMFDVAGLPPNEAGDPVFKMSYDSRTEFNVCYDVEGKARVRTAIHPYRASQQEWSEWKTVDSEVTYHLNEEPHDKSGGLRNRHEVDIAGHVTLFCMFDPAPVGIEQHRPGEYSDYAPLDAAAAEAFRKEVAEYDAMMDKLSLAKSEGRLEAMAGSPEWALYQRGAAAQRAREAKLRDDLTQQGRGREKIVARWMSSSST